MWIDRIKAKYHQPRPPPYRPHSHVLPSSRPRQPRRVLLLQSVQHLLISSAYQLDSNFDIALLLNDSQLRRSTITIVSSLVRNQSPDSGQITSSQLDSYTTTVYPALCG